MKLQGLTSINDILHRTVYTSSGSRVLISDPAYYWYEDVVSVLNELTSLKAGWDGYRAGPVLFENAHFALRVLSSICNEDTPSPHVIPGVQGDLQIEWHTLTGDLELHIRAPNDVHVWYSVEGGIEQEADLTFDFTSVVDWVKNITESAVDPVLAAA